MHALANRNRPDQGFMITKAKKFNVKHNVYVRKIHIKSVMLQFGLISQNVNTSYA